MSSKQVVPKPHPADPQFWTVENGLPDPIPVSKAELDTIEQYFGELLDSVLAPKPHAIPAAKSAHQKGDK